MSPQEVVQAANCVTVELTAQELGFLLGAIVTSSESVADPLIVRLAGAYHQARREQAEACAAVADFAELRALDGVAVAAARHSADAVLATAG
jgi:hypothetical protein